LNPNPIARALSTFSKYKVKSLLIGGQACILYGAAEFSRDVDLAVLVSPGNIAKIKKALEELDAENIYVPDLSAEALIRGHACHFRFPKSDPKGFRIDIIAKMRGVASFPIVWRNRNEVQLPEIGKIAVMGLEDLVRSKKTQRDKDWPMIRRLVESDIYNAAPDPAEDKIRFWLAECRTPGLLLSLVAKSPQTAQSMFKHRPLLQVALLGKEEEIQKELHEEEELERKRDRDYWAPLRKDLENWRQANSTKKQMNRLSKRFD
jgi:hypothetical protein